MEKLSNVRFLHINFYSYLEHIKTKMINFVSYKESFQYKMLWKKVQPKSKYTLFCNQNIEDHRNL